MDIVRVLELLNNHIIKLEEDNYFKELKINNLRKEIEHLKNGLEEKIKEYEKEIQIKKMG